MLTVEKASLHYGAAQALRGISLTAGMGRITCVLGRNGVGKSSLLRAITGQHPLSSGTVAFNDVTLDGMAPYGRARQGIGYVPQGREIFPLLTVRENLETGYAPLKRAERFVPDEIFSLFPVLQTMLGRRGGDLSGGQQQQLAIGRAIRYLRDSTDMAILLVEQYLDFCRELADHVYIMDRGEIVHEGAAETLDTPEARRHLTV